jgi:antirestriction protein
MTQDIDDIKQQIADMLKESPVMELYGETAEEWEIHDHEGFESVHVDNYNLDQLNEIAIALSESDDPEILADIFNDFYDGKNIQSAIDYIEENDAGEHSDLEEFAESYYSDCYEPIPKHLQYYIAWDKMARDMELNGEIRTYDTKSGVRVLWNR